VNLLGSNIDAIMKNTWTLINSSKVISLEVNRGNSVAVSSPECKENFGTCRMFENDNNNSKFRSGQN
jgi:hypothetical protein